MAPVRERSSMKSGKRSRKKAAAITPDTPILKAARRIIDRRLRAVEDALPRAARWPNAKTRRVHELRVGTRKADAALRTFRPFLDDAEYRKARRRLRRIRRAAGAARQCDVHMEVLSERRDRDGAERLAVLDDLVAWTRGQRARAQTRVREAATRFPQSRLRRARKRIVASLHRAKPGRFDDGKGHPVVPAIKTFGDLSRVVLPKLSRTVVDAAGADLERIENIHVLRLRGKRLRYALEIFEPCLDTAPRETDQLMRRLQDRLGAINDVGEIIHRIEAFRADRDARERIILARDNGLPESGWRRESDTLLEEFRHQQDELITQFMSQWRAGTWSNLLALNGAVSPAAEPAPAEAIR
jgi:CHAD domain-containing protein